MQLPDTLTEDLREILGLMLWETTPIAHLMQADGQPVPTRCEAEQAYVLFRLLQIYAVHGAGWRVEMGREIYAMQERIHARVADAADPNTPI